MKNFKILCAVLVAFCFFQKAQSQSCVNPPSGLVSWWPGDTDPQIIDDFNDGVIAPWILEDFITPFGSFSASETGGKLVFSAGGGDPSFRVANAVLNMTTPTADFVVSATVIGSFGGVSGNKRGGLRVSDGSGNSYLLQLGKDGANNFKWQVCGPSGCPVFSGYGTYAEGTSTRFQIVKTGTTISFYVDGVQVYSETATFSSLTKVLLNTHLANSADPYTVTFDDLHVFGRAQDLINANIGTLFGGAEVVTGKVGQAFSLDGINDYVSTTGNIGLSGDPSFTIEAWIYPLTTAPTFQIITAQAAFDSKLQCINLILRNGRLSLDFCSGGLTQSAPLTTNTWHHVAATKSPGLIGSTTRLYVDGIDVTAGAAVEGGSDGIPNVINTKIDIGIFSPSLCCAFSGLIDEVEIYNRALTASEIQAIFNAGSAGKCKPDADGDGVTDAVDACPATPPGTVVNASGCPAGQCFPPPSNLVSWWTGDGNANDIQDGNNGQLGTSSGTGDDAFEPTFVSGKVGNAFSFNGNQVVIVPHNANLNPVGSWTADAWIKTSQTVGAQIIARKSDVTGQAPWIIFVNAGKFGANFFTGLNAVVQIEDTKNVADGAFHHVVAVYNKEAATFKLFVDGVEDPATITAGSASELGKAPASNNERLVIGADIVDGSPLARQFNGVIDELEFYNRALSPSEIQAIFNAGSAGKCLPAPPIGSVAGQVTANCPSPNTPLQGVRVDAFAVVTGVLAGTAVTDANGNYKIDSLTPGDYTITLVTPLGYSTSSDQIMTTVVGGTTVNVNFSLSCVTIVANPRTIGFWKHQVGVALGGKGTAQINGTTLCGYLDLIAAHFNSNLINQVIVYQPPASGLCTDKLSVARDLLNLMGSVTMIARAKQQLMALLLNVAAGFISQTQVISADGATVSQAITYCDNLIDDTMGDHEKAKTIADLINNNQQVPAGVIPLNTVQIAYSIRAKGTIPQKFDLLQNFPNPFNATTTIFYDLPKDGEVQLVIYNIMGRKVKTLVNQRQLAGLYQVVWDGKDESGNTVASGVYFYRLKTDEFQLTNRMTLLK